MLRRNINDLQWDEVRSPQGRFNVLRKHLSIALGGIKDRGPETGGHPFDVELCRIPAGARNWPLHAHQVQWEFFLVLSGHGLLLTESGTSPIGPGDFLIAPPKAEAHQIHNTGAEPMELLIVADNPDTDVVRYPESQRTFTKPERIMRDASGRDVDFWQGEDPPGV